jgi:Protein of unknown function (DUF3667).
MTTTEPDLPVGPATATSVATEHCVVCRAPITTSFCARCGERRASDRKYTLLHFGHDLLADFAQLDGTVLRTLKQLVTRPGELTAAYMRGERIPYMKPLQLFVLVSVVYFVAASVSGARTFDTPLNLQYGYGGRHVVRLVDERIAQRKTTFDAYATTFDDASTSQAKSLVIVMVPFFALFVGAIESGKRRFALHHLIFSLHVYTALLVLSIFVDVLLAESMRWYSRWTHTTIGATTIDAVLTTTVLVAMFTYLVFALRVAYGDRWRAAVPKALVLLLAIGIALRLYRAFLFYTTFWFT